ncbi:transglycosylase SLT domain-containing protein [Propionivibrio limicola]|uniref:transglycosylase SLT domain-containing protein n=1 Tax=Propionivibrio limicola TaxID=167645 RepID=UPI0012913C62|nr:transglycosylase SLT domain-containing protein [Propionivibrio limicola]
MSATISLKRTVARSTDAALYLVQLGLLVAVLMFASGIFNVFANNGSNSADTFPGLLPVERANLFQSESEANSRIDAAAGESPSLSPRMLGALDYVKRRYRVSPEAMMPVFEAVQTIGKERQIDPLLIVAIIAIESRFNPFAESSMGARGLMQIIPRFHLDKLPEGESEQGLLDPVLNVKVGVHILEEAIRRRGGLVPGLQSYSGSSDASGSYASKVLAEKARLEQAAKQRSAGASSNAR